MDLENLKTGWSVFVLASFLFEGSATNLHDLLQPGPEPGTGGPEMVPWQLLEALGDPGLQLVHGVA